MDLHVHNLEAGAITDALIAIERARQQGVFDDEQIERLTPLVACMRLQSDEALRFVGNPWPAHVDGSDSAMITIVSPAGTQTYWPHYWSTYCIHGTHRLCRKTCKTCLAPCLCPCHQDPSDGSGEKVR